MIDPLSTGDCRVIHRTLRDLVGVRPGYDRAKAGVLVRAHVELLGSTAGRGDDERVVVLMVDLVVTCAALGMFGGDPDSRFGIALTERWLARNGYVLSPAAAERLRLLGAIARTCGTRPVCRCGTSTGSANAS